MTIPRFKDLCIDALDPVLLGGFWAEALGLRWSLHGNGEGDLSGVSEEQRIWVNRVPEPKTVPHRVRWDVLSPGSTGAAALTDPEGGEFRALPTAGSPSYRLHALVVDSVDPAAQARWWGDVYGAAAVPAEDGHHELRNIPGAPFSMVFRAVSEPKTVKNRIHWDVTGDPQLLINAGASLLRPQDGEIRWTVLADPEGNEFCAFLP